MKIDGFGITEYRSFGPEIQRIGPFAKISIFVGKNNSGKSNILRVLSKHYSKLILSSRGKATNFGFEEIDRHLGTTSGKFFFEPCLLLGGEAHMRILESLEAKLNHRTKEIVSRILNSEPLTHGTPMAWFKYEAAWGSQLALSHSQIDKIAQDTSISQNEWSDVWTGITGQGQGNLKKHWIPETISKLSPVQFDAPQVRLIPAIREIGQPGIDASEDFGGSGIIDRLAMLQNPDINSQSDKETFNQIQDFVRNVTGLLSAEIEIPYQRDSILVHENGKTLPLSSMGTGIHEVVILAAAATVINDQAICIEEPELHMHPILQRKLIDYLSSSTTNQYFISTHSAHILDSPEIAVFHASLSEGQTFVEGVISGDERHSVCADLGYRPSDLVQTNCVIWVEGPSDRVYLKYWLNELNPSLVEGIHYSIMFYGGNLLRHLTANDPSVEEFISLRRLNRNVAIVMDSDRKKAGQNINSTKQRVRKELGQAPGFAWVTSCREIENYQPYELFSTAVKSVHPSVRTLVDYRKYGNPLDCLKSNGDPFTSIDKVKIAKKAVSKSPNLDLYDLRRKVQQLEDFIIRCNDDCESA